MPPLQFLKHPSSHGDFCESGEHGHRHVKKLEILNGQSRIKRKSGEMTVLFQNGKAVHPQRTVPHSSVKQSNLSFPHLDLRFSYHVEGKVI